MDEYVSVSLHRRVYWLIHHRSRVFIIILYYKYIFCVYYIVYYIICVYYILIYIYIYIYEERERERERERGFTATRLLADARPFPMRSRSLYRTASGSDDRFTTFEHSLAQEVLRS